MREKEPRKQRTMSRWTMAGLIALALSGSTSFNLTHGYFGEYRFNDAACDEKMWDFIDSPNRLVPMRGEESCIESVTGIVADFAQSPDGDLVIDFVPDKKYQYLLEDPFDDNDILDDDDPNISKLDGTLRAEVICNEVEKGLQGEEAEAKACLGYDLIMEKVVIPKLRKGMHISVTGVLVTDVGRTAFANKGWNEIHPVSKIVVIPTEKGSIIVIFHEISFDDEEEMIPYTGQRN